MGTGAETTSERISKIIPGFLLHIVLYERLCSTILWNTTFITRGTYRGHLDSISRIQGGCNLDGSAHLHRWGTGFRHHRVSMHEPEAAYVQTAGHSGRNAIAASGLTPAVIRFLLFCITVGRRDAARRRLCVLVPRRFLPFTGPCKTSSNWSGRPNLAL